MVGVVLAAGKGTRLAELNLKHKSFAIVKKKHIINFSLDLLIGNDESAPLVNEIIIVVGYNKEVIIETLGSCYRGVPIKYVHQKELKGVAHAILTAREVIKEDFIMCLADEILINPNLDGMIKDFYEKDAICVCGGVYDSNDFSGKPIAYDLDSENRILKVTEKPEIYPNDFRGVGECIFKKECLEYLSKLKPNAKRGELEMGDWIQMAADDKGSAYIYKLADAYVNINYAKDIEIATQMLEKK